MRYIQKYDILNQYHSEKDLLLLHPELIKDELKKLEKKCPIKITIINDEEKNILVVNKPIELHRYTYELVHYVPKDIIVPIGGLNEKYHIRLKGSYLDKDNYTQLKGLDLINASNGNVILESQGMKPPLFYLSRNFAYLGDLIITKNTITYNKESEIYFFENSGYYAIRCNNKNYFLNEPYLIYNNQDEVINAVYGENEIRYIDNNAPVLPYKDLSNNTIMFEQMILNSLRDKKELLASNSETIEELVDYIWKNGLELAIDLDSLGVYKVNYNKYFNEKCKSLNLKK